MEATQHGPWPHWRDAQTDRFVAYGPPGQAVLVRRFDLARDYAELCAWWQTRGEPRDELDQLPPVGFVAMGTPSAASAASPPQSRGETASIIEEALAVCFLGILEGTRVCELMHLTTNPHASRRAQMRGVQGVVEGCLAEAARRGMTTKRALTWYPYVARLAIRKYGFQLLRPAQPPRGFKPGQWVPGIFVAGRV